MSIESDWKDLARGSALREWQSTVWDADDGSLWKNGLEVESSRDLFSGLYVRHAFIRGYVMGFLAAKKRDVVTVDPYKVEPNGK